MSTRIFFATSVALLSLIVLAGGCGDDTVSPSGSGASMLPPQNVVVSQGPLGAVLISWDASTQSDLEGYNVYRRDTGTTSVEKLTTAPIPETQLIDRGANLQREYEYRVTSVSTLGNESGYVASIIQLQTPDMNGRKHSHHD